MCRDGDARRTLRSNKDATQGSSVHVGSVGGIAQGGVVIGTIGTNDSRRRTSPAVRWPGSGEPRGQEARIDRSCEFSIEDDAPGDLRMTGDVT
jgi:hypothetical protein